MVRLASLVALWLAACGQHTFVDLDEAHAERLPDGRVRVTATVSCEKVGSIPCAELGDYCVIVRWSDADGGATSSDRTCVKNTLEPSSHLAVTVVSSGPLAAADSRRASVRIESPSGAWMKGLGARGSPTTVDVP